MIEKTTSELILSYLKLVSFIIVAFIAVETRYAKEEKIKEQELVIKEQQEEIKKLQSKINGIFNNLPDNERKLIVERIEIEQKFDQTKK